MLLSVRHLFYTLEIEGLGDIPPTTIYDTPIDGVSIKRIYLDKNGYANGGRYYYGTGDPLFLVESNEYSAVVRAKSRQGLKKWLHNATKGKIKFLN